MFTTPEHRTIVAMLAAGSPVWYVAAVTKSDRHYVYKVGAQHGYPNRAAMRQSLQHLAGPRCPTGRGTNHTSNPLSRRPSLVVGLRVGADDDLDGDFGGDVGERGITRRDQPVPTLVLTKGVQGPTQVSVQPGPALDTNCTV